MIIFLWEVKQLAPEKISTEQMIEEVADKLIVYLKDGQLSTQSFLRKINLDIENIKELLHLHFLIKKEVVKFIQYLPWRIRNIKTSNEKINKTYRNKIQGKIDWQSTITGRYRQNYRDNTLFVCEQTNKNFNIKENIILKKLLSIIYGIIINDLQGKPEKYSWLDEWLGDENLAVGLEELYFRNIYLNKIDIQEVTVTDRMIQDTKSSRNILYQEAAELLEFYREQIEREGWRENVEEITELLKDTFIKPEKESVLFELYWVLKLLDYNAEKYQMHLIKEGQNMVAHWEKGERNYTLYHDSNGSKELDWFVNIDEFPYVNNEYLFRRIRSRREAQKASAVFNSPIKSTLWAGRPDLIVEVRENGKLNKVIIGEIKYTNNEETAKQGLKELFDYCQLLKYKKKYVQYEDVEVVGLLLVDNIKLPDGDSLKALKLERNGSRGWESECKLTGEMRF